MHVSEKRKNCFGTAQAIPNFCSKDFSATLCASSFVLRLSAVEKKLGSVGQTAITPWENDGEQQDTTERKIPRATKIRDIGPTAISRGHRKSRPRGHLGRRAGKAHVSVCGFDWHIEPHKWKRGGWNSPSAPLRKLDVFWNWIPWRLNQSKTTGVYQIGCELR
jgi:hypothetical protein